MIFLNFSWSSRDWILNIVCDKFNKFSSKKFEKIPCETRTIFKKIFLSRFILGFFNRKQSCSLSRLECSLISFRLRKISSYKFPCCKTFFEFECFVLNTKYLNTYRTIRTNPAQDLLIHPGKEISLTSQVTVSVENLREHSSITVPNEVPSFWLGCRTLRWNKEYPVSLILSSTPRCFGVILIPNAYPRLFKFPRRQQAFE